MSKFKILKDYQLTTEDKKIIILKAKVFIVDNVYLNKDVKVTLDPLLVENNPEYFQFIDWKTDFINFLKTSKIAQPSVIAKKLFPYIEENFKSDEVITVTKTDDAAIEKIEKKYQSTLEELAEQKETIQLESEKQVTNHNAELDKLNSEKEKLNKTLSDTKDELRNLKLVMVEQSNGGDSITKSYQDQIAKLELSLANLELKKSKYTQDVEEEMIAKLREVNERMEAVIKREGEVRAIELNSNNALHESLEIKERNTITLADIESRERMIELKLNDLSVREKQSQAMNVDKIIEDAIIEYEKGIPWQYHKKR